MKKFKSVIFISSFLIFAFVGMFFAIDYPKSSKQQPQTVESVYGAEVQNNNRGLDIQTDLPELGISFTVVHQNQLTSCLKISFDSNNGKSYSDFSIYKAGSGAGARRSKVTKDEKGEAIKSQDFGKKTYSYYFTTQSTYIVSCTYREDGSESSITKTAQCYFTPMLNEEYIRTKVNNVKYIGGRYYTFGDGVGTGKFTPVPNSTAKIEEPIVIPFQFDSSLYDLYINETKIIPEKGSQNIDTYNLTVPANCFGDYDIKLISRGYVTKTFTITAVNPQYEYTFLNSQGVQGLEASHTHSLNGETYYVFNESVKMHVGVSKFLVDTNNNRYTGEAYKQAANDCLSYINIYSSEFVRDSYNTTSTALNPIQVKEVELNSEGEDNYSITYPIKDHSIFKISSKFKNTENILRDNILQFKIITKIPLNKNSQNNSIYDIGLFLSPDVGENTINEKVNFFNTALHGYLPQGTTISLQEANTYIINQSNYKIDYARSGADTEKGSIFNSKSGNSLFSTITTDGYNGYISTRSIRIKNSTATTAEKDTYNGLTDVVFDNFYVFDFDVKYQNYSTLTYFYNYIFDVNSALTVGNQTDSISNFLGSSYSIGTQDTLLTSPTIKVSDNYDIACMPVYMRVTYNNKVYENFYTLKNGDEITFHDYGTYTLELYTFPSYEFCEEFVKSWPEDSSVSLSHYYIKFEFTIKGPSIKTESVNSSRQTFSASNYMITDQPVDTKLSLNANQSWEIYCDNKLRYYGSNNINDTISGIGTWKIFIYNENHEVIKSTCFIIIDSSYQGFSINNRDEYESLIVKKLDPETNTYITLDKTNCYHLTEDGKYNIQIVNGEKFYFKLNGETKSASKLVTNSLNISILQSFFDIKFKTGQPGDKITANVEIESYDGVQLQKIEIFRGKKFVAEIIPDQAQSGAGGSGIDGFLGGMSSGNSQSDMGVYTIKMTDKFGNTYEVQIEKYYKANAALILLIIAGSFGAIYLLYFIFRSKRGLKVK